MYFIAFNTTPFAHFFVGRASSISRHGEIIIVYITSIFNRILPLPLFWRIFSATNPQKAWDEI